MTVSDTVERVARDITKFCSFDSQNCTVTPRPRKTFGEIYAAMLSASRPEGDKEAE